MVAFKYLNKSIKLLLFLVLLISYITPIIHCNDSIVTLNKLIFAYAHSDVLTEVCSTSVVTTTTAEFFKRER